MHSTAPNRTIVRVTREFAFSGLWSPLYVVVDEVMLGRASLNRPCDFQVSPGEHQVYIRGGKTAFSNALDIDLLEGSVATYGCRWDPLSLHPELIFDRHGRGPAKGNCPLRAIALNRAEHRRDPRVAIHGINLNVRMRRVEVVMIGKAVEGRPNSRGGWRGGGSAAR